METTLHAKSVGGKIVKKIVIFTNDPANKTVPIYLKAFVKRDYDLFPPMLSFRSAPKDKSSTTKIRVVPHSDNFKIYGISKDVDWLDAKIEKKNVQNNGKNGYEYILHFTLHPERVKGSLTSLHGKVILKTNSKWLPDYEIPVHVFFRKDYRFVPFRTHFNLSNKKDVRRNVDIISTKAKKFTIEKVRVLDNSTMTAEISFNNSVGNRITLKLKPEAFKRKFFRNTVYIYVKGLKSPLSYDVWGSKRERRYNNFRRPIKLKRLEKKDEKKK